MPVEADPATITKAAKDTREAKQMAESELKRLYDTVIGFAPSFKGQAGASFQTLMRNWDEQSKRLTGAMEGISEALEQSATSITMTDEEQMQDFNKFRDINQ